ncbi:pyrroloquinoline quinone biosynthesis protein A [Paraburkholderia tropica]
MPKFDTMRVRRMARVFAHPASACSTRFNERSSAMWTKPAYTDLRLGFEITMYISNR